MSITITQGKDLHNTNCEDLRAKLRAPYAVCLLGSLELPPELAPLRPNYCSVSVSSVRDTIQVSLLYWAAVWPHIQHRSRFYRVAGRPNVIQYKSPYCPGRLSGRT